MKQNITLPVSASLMLFFVLDVFNSSGQQFITPTTANGDCSGAVEIKDSVLTSVTSPVGYGNELEISGNKSDDIYYFKREHNTIWYWFKVKNDAELTFDITPQYIHDDYDFSLYRFTDSSFCADVKSKKLLPIRTCISRNDPLELSMTGLRHDASERFIHSGIGPSYAAPVLVSKGETYYLIVDNVYANGRGHTIRLHYKLNDPPIANNDTLKEEIKKIIPEVGKSLIFSNIQFYGNEALFLPTAEPALDSLLEIMKDNPALKIEIQGHVNGPFMGNSQWFQDLSEQRAEAVYQFLLQHQIPANRMEHHGYGNTRMLFPNAESEDQMQQNRRVEIKIISK